MRKFFIIFCLITTVLSSGKAFVLKAMSSKDLMNTVHIVDFPSKRFISFAKTISPIEGFVHNDSLPDKKDTLLLSNNIVKNSVFDQFYRDSALEVTIKFDLTEVKKNLRNEIYTEGSFVYKDRLGESVKHKIKVRCRGKTRRKLCDFPPLRLKFKKKQLEKRNLASYTNYKLVTHCFDSKQAEQQIMKEFLVYKLYSIISEESFRVQLLKINYIDSRDSLPEKVKYGFLIENTEEVAQRMDSQHREQLFNCPLESLNKEAYFRLTLYQFLIGNTDWYIRRLHNVKLFESPVAKTIFAIPYDFDYSGIVNAEYAKPNPNLGQVEVTERIFMNKMNNKALLYAIISEFKTHEMEIQKYCEDFPHLTKHHKRELKSYINSFFNIIESKKLKKKYLIKGRAEVY